MYLTVIAWIYVVLMMSVVEATSATGTVLGALMTFLLYGVLPLGLVTYLMRSPARRRAIKQRERSEAASVLPDTGDHATSAPPVESVAAMRKEP